MTLELASVKDQTFFVEAMREGWEAAGVFPTLVFHIGGEDYSDAIPTGTVSQNGIAIGLDATLAGPLPLRQYGDPVTLDITAGGHTAPLIRGDVSLPEEDDSRSTTTFRAASVGSYADKYPLNETLEYSGVSPTYVVRAALGRLPYEPGSVRVDEVGAPTLYFARATEDGPFARTDNVAGILSKVQEKVPSFSFHDTPFGGHDARISAGLATIPEVPEHMRFRAQDLVFWKSPALALQQYAQVVVYKENADGSDAFEASWANVVYPGRNTPPRAGLILQIAFTGTDASEAQKVAYLKALELGRGLYKNEPVFPFSPLLQSADYAAITEAKEEVEGEGFYEREWLHYADSYEHSWALDSQDNAAGFATKAGCTVTLANEQLVKAPTLLLELVFTSGILKTPIELIPFVANAAGFFFDASVTATYVSNDATGLYVDPALSNGNVTHGSDGFYFEI